MIHDRVRALGYASMCVAGGLGLFLPAFASSLMIEAGGFPLAMLYGLWLILTGLPAAISSWLDRPLIEYTVIPLAASALVGYSALAVFYERGGMAMMNLIIVAQLLSRWIEIHSEINQFRKEVTS
ncbi:hypothetical protein ACN20G_29925 (plasmid) [Streptomyces sp. BI20]|uniref:hypothetical protein n=1 Tax=Streptomyces sp. BI20 TaxID=3403460 RepID=UPI003C728F55